MKSIIVGTAGHIDHGKTALVRALTGIDADRLPEEKRRGITIDIGFADLDLGDVRVGFVDVPGHERFVKNMLAGAHGIDVVALVIAADEGVMPQTREHFEICRLLDVRAGLVVLTKKDLVEKELLDLVRAEASELVAGSFLEEAPMVAVSSRTGAGIEDLKTTLREVCAQVPSRSHEQATRLPIDRVFTMSGFGAVVTGTLIAGQIDEGDELELIPGTRVRVRGLQVHGAKVPRASAGQRTAVNLGGVEASTMERGMVLAPVNKLRPTQIIDAEVQILAEAPRPLRSRQRVRVHVGAAEVLARVKVLDRGTALPPVNQAQEARATIAPGDRGFAQLRFETPVVGVIGDRFIIRSYSPQRTIGGGRIADPFAAKHRAKDFAATRDRITALLSGNHQQMVELLTAATEERGLKRSDLIARTGWREEIAEAAIDAARNGGSVIDVGGELLSPSVFTKLKSTVLNEVTAHHKSEPLSRGLAKEILRGRHFGNAPPDLFRAVLAQLESESALTVEKDVVRRREHTRAGSGADAELRDRLEKIYRDAKLAPPGIAEAFAQAGVAASAQAHARKLLQVLIDSGILVRVDGEMFFHREALDELIARLRARAQKQRAIDVPAFKDLAGISRKYAIPLLEFLDRERVTRREGDKRVIL
ncbi:MAG TPA: selenocysteine-specific translation elongation factor [Pyrinomonadaceae bacterium]|nr:selenocysteine-specific translation elongation factor [Pyrinomonadaceae bacterium]